MMEQIGFNQQIEKALNEQNPEGFALGRVTSEQKENYQVLTTQGEYRAEITGNLRFKAQAREDLPCVGDWVLLSLYDNQFAVIHRILTRYSLIKRRAVDQLDTQLIAANVDYALLVQAADRDFNLNRLERYLILCEESGVQPLTVITKIDLFPETTLQSIQTSLENRLKTTRTFFISNKTGQGLDLLKAEFQSGKTYCLLGSSGVGKSTLLNCLLEHQIIKTGELSLLTQKGKHTTSSRGMYFLTSGAILVDTPGLREVGVIENDAGIAKTFEAIESLARHCRFTNCQHIQEAGCAVLEALEKKELDPHQYANYLKLKKENAYTTATKAERRKKEKVLGKVIKKYLKNERSDLL